MKTGFALLTTVISLILGGCTSKTTTAPTYQAVANMRYMAANQKIHAELRFTPILNDGKSKLPTEASFNAEPMKWIESGLGVFIFDGGSSPIDGSHLISWKTDAKNQESIKLQLPEMREIAFATPKLSHGSATKLTWKGDPLKKADSIVLLWDDQQNRATYQTQAIGASSVTVLDIPAFELKKVPVGKYKVTVIRKVLITMPGTTCDIKAQGEYYHIPFEVEMTK